VCFFDERWRGRAAFQQQLIHLGVEGFYRAVGLWLKKGVVEGRVFGIVNGGGVHELLAVVELPTGVVADDFPAGELAPKG
jgi:hypothetical protein